MSQIIHSFDEKCKYFCRSAILFSPNGPIVFTVKHDPRSIIQHLGKGFLEDYFCKFYNIKYFIISKSIKFGFNSKFYNLIPINRYMKLSYESKKIGDKTFALKKNKN